MSYLKQAMLQEALEDAEQSLSLDQSKENIKANKGGLEVDVGQPKSWSYIYAYIYIWEEALCRLRIDTRRENRPSPLIRYSHVCIYGDYEAMYGERFDF